MKSLVVCFAAAAILEPRIEHSLPTLPGSGRLDDAVVPIAGQGPGVVTCRSDSSVFAFRNGMWLNLFSFLFQEAERNRGVPDDGLGGLGNVMLESRQTCPLTTEEERTWGEVLRYYGDVVLLRSVTDGHVMEVNQRLALAADTQQLAPGEFPLAFREAMATAATIYRDAYWPVHHRLNDAWIAEMQSLLEQHEAYVGPELATLLGSKWTGQSIPVHASVYASWYGAYTTREPPHITMSSTAIGNRGSAGLEGLLHEAGHTMLQGLDSLAVAIARDRGVTIQGEFSHTLLFYTAGYVVHRAIPDHTPNAERFGIWDRSRQARELHALLERVWLPYLERKRPLADAMVDLLTGLESLSK